jgi:hypothetical protein
MKDKNTTISELARRFKCDRATIRKHLEADGIMEAPGGGYEESAAETALEDSLPTNALIRALRAEVLKEQARKFKLANDVRARDLIGKDEIKRTVTKMIVGAKSRLQGGEKAILMKARMNMGLNDEQTAQLSQILAFEHVQVMTSMSKGEWFEATCPNCAKELL